MQKEKKAVSSTNKKKRIRKRHILIIAVMSLFFFSEMWNNFYRTDVDFSERRPGGRSLSPDGEYELRVSMELLRGREDREYYLEVELTKVEYEFIESKNVMGRTYNNRNTRTIYFDKREGNFQDEVIEVQWLGDRVFEVEGQKLFVYGPRYDYRRWWQKPVYAWMNVIF